VALLIPAVALAALFLAPVFFVNAMGDNLRDACSVKYEDGRALRVVTETGHWTTTSLSMKWQPDDSWQTILIQQRPYHLPVADCSNVLFLDELTVLYTGKKILLVDASAATTNVHVNAECDTVESLRLTDKPDVFSMRCDNGELFNVRLPIASS
jgi:hypothetical protein